MSSSTNVGEALEAFILERGYYGGLDGGVEGDRVWMTKVVEALPRIDSPGG